jgi:STE24 endopeptidase
MGVLIRFWICFSQLLDCTAQASRYHRLRYILFFVDLALFITVLSGMMFAGISVSLETLSGQWSGGNAYGTVFYFVLLLHLGIFMMMWPLRFIRSYRLEKQFNLCNENLNRWVLDDVKSFILSLAVTLPTVQAFYFFAKWQPVHAWIPLSMLWLGGTVFLSMVFPSLIVPLFYPMKPLEDQGLKERLQKLSVSLGVPIQKIFVIVLSRKTRKANAAVMGLGKDRRIVLGDTLLKEFEPEEIEVVLGHELGHYKMHHMIKGLLAQFFVVTLGLYVVFSIFDWQGRGIVTYPALLVGVALFHVLMMPLSNAVSRIFERQADRFALKKTGLKKAFVTAMQRLAQMNMAEVSPNRFIEWMFYTHPPIGKRIQFAEDAKGF